jgi:hypothetical protein
MNEPKSNFGGNLIKEILNHKYFLTLFVSFGILSYLIIHNSTLLKTVSDLKQPMLIPIAKLLILFCGIFFSILFLCWIYSKINKWILNLLANKKERKKEIENVKYKIKQLSLNGKNAFYDLWDKGTKQIEYNTSDPNKFWVLELNNFALICKENLLCLDKFGEHHICKVFIPQDIFNLLKDVEISAPGKAGISKLDNPA